MTIEVADVNDVYRVEKKIDKLAAKLDCLIEALNIPKKYVLDDGVVCYSLDDVKKHQDDTKKKIELENLGATGVVPVPEYEVWPDVK